MNLCNIYTHIGRTSSETNATSVVAIAVSLQAATATDREHRFRRLFPLAFVLLQLYPCSGVFLSDRWMVRAASRSCCRKSIWFCPFRKRKVPISFDPLANRYYCNSNFRRLSSSSSYNTIPLRALSTITPSYFTRSLCMYVYAVYRVSQNERYRMDIEWCKYKP